MSRLISISSQLLMFIFLFICSSTFIRLNGMLLWCSITNNKKKFWKWKKTCNLNVACRQWRPINGIKISTAVQLEPKNSLFYAERRLFTPSNQLMNVFVFSFWSPSKLISRIWLLHWFIISNSNSAQLNGCNQFCAK